MCPEQVNAAKLHKPCHRRFSCRPTRKNESVQTLQCTKKTIGSATASVPKRFISSTNLPSHRASNLAPCKSRLQTGARAGHNLPVLQGQNLSKGIACARDRTGENHHGGLTPLNRGAGVAQFRQAWTEGPYEAFYEIPVPTERQPATSERIRNYVQRQHCFRNHSVSEIESAFAFRG